MIGQPQGISEEANVFGNARVFGGVFVARQGVGLQRSFAGDAQVSDHAIVFGNALVEGDAVIDGTKRVGNPIVAPKL